MKIKALRKVVAIAALGAVSVSAMAAGDNGRADRMGERALAEINEGRATYFAQVLNTESQNATRSLVTSPNSGVLDNLADLKVQNEIGQYSHRLQLVSDPTAITSPAASSAVNGAGAEEMVVLGLSYTSIDYGDITASQKRQRFFGQDG